MRLPRNAVLLIVLLAFVDLAQAQSAQEAIRAFSKLEARLEVGITYREYVAALGEVNFEIKSFADSNDAKMLPQIYEALELALSRHRIAQMMWGKTFGRYPIETLPNNSDVAKLLLSDYPEAARSVEDGGAMIAGKFDVMKILPLIWGRASQDVAVARKIFGSLQ